jgi:hypothetical protein
MRCQWPSCKRPAVRPCGTGKGGKACQPEEAWWLCQSHALQWSLLERPVTVGDPWLHLQRRSLRWARANRIAAQIDHEEPDIHEAYALWTDRAHLDARARDVVWRRYVERVTLEETAAPYRVCRERVRQWLDRAVERLRWAVPNEELTPPARYSREDTVVAATRRHLRQRGDTTT